MRGGGGPAWPAPAVMPVERLTDLEHPSQRIRAKAGLEDVRLHDLRHSFASVAAAGRHSLPIIGALLGHAQTATTQGDAHVSAKPLARRERFGSGHGSAATLRGDKDASSVVAFERTRSLE